MSCISLSFLFCYLFFHLIHLCKSSRTVKITNSIYYFLTGFCYFISCNQHGLTGTGFIKFFL